MGRIYDSMVNDNTTRRTYYNVVDLSKDTPKNATDEKGCGCYTIEVSSESDRCWVTYTTVITNHYLCAEHMKKHHIEVERVKQKTEKMEKEWKERHEKAKVNAEQEGRKIVATILELKLPRVRDVVSVCMKNGWKCSMHRGFINVNYDGKEGEIVGSRISHNLRFNYKRHGIKLNTYFKKLTNKDKQTLLA